MNMNQVMCPFCPLMGIGPEHYLPIGNEFFGVPAQIGGIRSCEACAVYAEIGECADELVKELREKQAQEVKP
jgi:hypothetical protein